MAKQKRFKWVVELEIDPVWVADGFDPANEQIETIMHNSLAYVRFDELKAKVLKRPADKDIARAQGYPTVKAYRAANWKNGRRIVD